MLRMVIKLQARWRARQDMRRNRGFVEQRKANLRQVLADHVVRCLPMYPWTCRLDSGLTLCGMVLCVHPCEHGASDTNVQEVPDEAVARHRPETCDRHGATAHHGQSIRRSHGTQR